MSDMTRGENIQMMIRDMQRQVKQADEAIARYADSIISDANDVKRRLQDGGTVYDFHGSQSVVSLQQAIDKRKHALETLSNLEFINSLPGE